MEAPVICGARDGGAEERKRILGLKQLKGCPAFGEEGPKVGDLHHVLIGRSSGRIECAILSFGGVLGLGERRFRLPWACLEPDAQRNGYVARVPADFLPSVLTAVRSQEPIHSAGYTPGLAAHAGVAWPILLPPIAPEPRACSSRSDDELISSEEIAGLPVLGPGLARLGVMDDILFDAASGEVHSGVIAAESAGRSRMAAIAWHSLSYDPDRASLVAAVPSLELDEEGA